MARSRNRSNSDPTRLAYSSAQQPGPLRNKPRRHGAPGEHAARSLENPSPENPTRFDRTGAKPDVTIGMPYTDKFAVRGLIGQGGTSRVLLGYDRLIGREVAIKELLDTEADARSEDSVSTEMTERFEREIEITGQLEHPGIVPVYEAGFRPGGIGYYTMKYVRGHTLKEAVERCESLSAELSFAHRMKLLDNVIDVCDAIAYAHSKEVIHRDIKPENIVLGRFGETVVIDWGLAKVLGRDETVCGQYGADPLDDQKGQALTRMGSIFGTPRYMAPEQAGGRTGKFSDVYSLGTVLFFVLTGRPAYSGTLNEVIAGLTSDAPSPTAQQILPFVPPELSAICAKAMAKIPAERFSDARELAEQLHAYRDGRLISTYAYTRGELFRRFVSRNKSWMIAIAIVMTAVVGAAAASMKYALEAHQARARADAALADITTLSQMAIRHSQEITEVVEKRLKELSGDMEDTAKELARTVPGNLPRVQVLLAELNSRYPNIDHFMTVDQKGRVTEYSPGQSVQTGEMPPFDVGHPHRAHTGALTTRFGRIFDHGDEKFFLPVRAPIVASGDPIGYLVALLRPTQFLSDLIMSAAPPGKIRPQAWLMQDDGLILYDILPKRIGVNLYTDLDTRGSPTLQALAIRVKTEETGIGYYSLSRGADQREVDKVTAWDTIQLDDDLQWKVISYFEYQNH